jgi:phosphoglycolate phosphatase
MKVLHIAPEPSLAKAFRAYPDIEYHPVDFNPELYQAVGARKFDLCRDAKSLRPGYYDLIVHNHVLEHIRCDYTAAFLYLHRALSLNGLHVFSVPFWPNRHYDEYLGHLDAQIAVKRFGQSDHCRTFSTMDLENTFGMFLSIDLESFIPSRIADDAELDSINFPESIRDRLDGSSTIVLTKEDVCFA